MKVYLSTKKDQRKNQNRVIVKGGFQRIENTRGETDYKYRNDIYRPTIRINQDTPTAFKELTKDQNNRAKKNCINCKS